MVVWYIDNREQWCNHALKFYLLVRKTGFILIFCYVLQNPFSHPILFVCFLQILIVCICLKFFYHQMFALSSLLLLVPRISSHFHRHSTSPLWAEFSVWESVRGLTLLYLQNGLELFVQVHLRPNLLLYEYTTEWAPIVAVPAWDLLKEVTIIFSNSTIVQPQVKSSEGT